MPLPLIPLVLGTVSLIAGATGVKKGLDAKRDLERAREIGADAERAHRLASATLDAEREQTQQALQAFGQYKAQVFSQQIRHLVETLKKGRSKLEGHELQVSPDMLKDCERAVIASLEIQKGLASGAAAGALTAMGAYGTVGTLGVASTGAAISGLSGVAATNATLAWLGGGALSAGGLGVAGGTAVLGGLVAGPALAVGGFMLASRAEQALSEAWDYERRVAVAVEQMKTAGTGLKAIRSSVAELQAVIERLVHTFERVKVADRRDEAAFARMVQVGKALKQALDIKVLDGEGAARQGLALEAAGLLEVAGPEAR